MVSVKIANIITQSLYNLITKPNEAEAVVIVRTILIGYAITLGVGVMIGAIIGVMI